MAYTLVIAVQRVPGVFWTELHGEKASVILDGPQDILEQSFPEGLHNQNN